MAQHGDAYRASLTMDKPDIQIHGEDQVDDLNLNEGYEYPAGPDYEEDLDEAFVGPYNEDDLYSDDDGYEEATTQDVSVYTQLGAAPGTVDTAVPGQWDNGDPAAPPALQISEFLSSEFEEVFFTDQL